MTICFEYRAYHQYNGPDHKVQVRSRKSDRQVADALEGFESDLRLRLPAPHAIVSTESPTLNQKSVDVTVETILDEAAVNAAMKGCLNEFDIFADKLKDN